MAGNVQKFGLLKIHSLNGVTEARLSTWETPFFDSKFFSKALRNFSKHRMSMFNIFGDLSNIISLRTKKKLGSYETSNRSYGRKPTKVLIFGKSILRIGLMKYMGMVQKYLFLKIGMK